MTLPEPLHVDHEVFAQLRDLETARPGTLAELTGHFVADGEAHLKQLEEGGEEQLEAVVVAAHSLKGCGGMIGAKEIARLAGIIELEGRAGRLAPDQVGQLRPAFEDFVQWLRRPDDWS